MKTKIITLGLLLSLGVGTSYAQKTKALEISLDGSTIQTQRISLRQVRQSTKGYNIALEERKLMFGGGISLAQELKPWLYLDTQAKLFYDKFNEKNNIFAQAGVGLQARFTPLLEHLCIDPYLRVGLAYEYRDLASQGQGSAQVNGKPIAWQVENAVNAKHSYPLMLGAGLNFWLTDSFGLGLETNYAMHFFSENSNTLQASLKLNYRIGGKPKHKPNLIIYQEVERFVDRPVYIEVEKKVIEDRVFIAKPILFDFDKAEIRSDQEARLDLLAHAIINQPKALFLITGTADSKGHSTYNEKLSRQRAEAVQKALIKRGVNPQQLKVRGIGKRATFISSKENSDKRQFDRRVFVEIIETT